MVMGEIRQEADVVVVGGGPGGYAAAFRAAELGLETILVDRREKPGGVCLYDGCIPSKTLLHAAALLEESRQAEKMGLYFSVPNIKLDELRNWKNGIVQKLTTGLATLAAQRNVDFIRANATFDNSRSLRLQGSDVAVIDFKQAILATGSRPMSLPGITIDSPRVMDSSAALALAEVPPSLLVVGGGYIGLELGTVYAALGSQVTVVEMTGSLLPGVDRDLVKPLERKARSIFKQVHLNTRVVAMTEIDDGIEVQLQGPGQEDRLTFDRVLVAVGRRPNSAGLALENTRIQIDQQGFVQIDQQCRTRDPHLYAIGDVAGPPMLAHKAIRQGKVAAEVIAGQPSAFDNQAIPAVVFTDPEVAWCGLTQTEAKARGITVRVARFPWSASGRAATLGRAEGMTKMIFEPDSGRVLGVGIVGYNAGELIAEAVLAVEMGAVAEDLALTIHAHPTLSETVAEVADVFLGSATHLFLGKK